MRAKKDNLEKKRTKRDSEDSESESESYQSSSTNSDSESSSSLDSNAYSGHDVHEEPPQQQEIRSKKRMIQLLFSQLEDTPLAVAFENIRKRKKQQRGDKNTKKKLSQINEGDETRMFDTFETVNLRGDDSGNVVVEGPVVVPSQPSHKENEVLQAKSEQHEKRNDAKEEGEDASVEGEDAAVKIPPNIEDVVQEELQPKPLVVIMPIQPEQQSGGTTEVDPDPINIQTHVEPKLTLRPWLQPEADTSAAKGPIESPDEVITHVLLSMNQERPSTPGGEQIEQTKDEDQCKTLETTPVSLKEMCFIWVTMDNDNKYETIFQLRGPNMIEAMRYNFMTMVQGTCIDMQMVSLVCHILNREELERFQRDMQMIRMFQTYGTNYLDKKTKMPYLVSQLKDQHYLELLDKEKLRKHSTLFAPVLHAHHWWLYVLDVDSKEFYVVDSVYGTNTNQMRNKLHRFAPNQTDCGVYVMKWMKLLDVAALSAAHTFKLPYNIEEWSQDQLDQFRKDIVANLIMSKENTLNVEAIKQASNMTLEAITETREKMGRKPKPSVALKSPFVQVSTAELEKKH
ncbi:hypothetical protein PIB30_064654 [Stylosanthes scabra]|uniref:Ubiquitin-like protease family profile domain-containing protein n=1 Tax=Stylosanthes scabra TaxID=79078 RepID=A0ABU6QMF3_9FABA|nr:hypothetical protein [Stylosanthes scabra]